MSERISTERLFSLSTFEGLRLLKKYEGRQPNLPTSELIALVKTVDPNGAFLDLDASAYLATIIDDVNFEDGLAFYQTCIKCVLIEHQPIWAKAMRTGRKRFIRSLDQNDQDVFAAAGLVEDPPSAIVISWWDDVVGYSRLITDKKKMEQARAAEILSLNHERERLKNIGIEKEPEWPGLDDNFAGYDILSYDHGPHGIINRMIEVKSTTSSPLQFFVTRNEWQQACKARSVYLFHVWDMGKSEPVLHVRTVDEIERHIPSDNEKGRWSTATIPLGAKS